MQLTRRACALTALAVLAALSLAACGHKDNTARATGIPSTTTTSSTLAPLAAAGH
jgi:predicted small secreted protein